MADGYLSQVGSSLAAPSKNMSWLQLGAAVGFVMVAAIAWRQVTLMIMNEL
jgi:hypothetical protein